MDNNLAVSFASLVKSNNGFFKSEKQAAFLLGKCQEVNVFYAGGNVYGNSFTLSYVCDEKGVVKVEKYLPKTGKVETTFMRHVEGTENAVEKAAKAKEYKRITREIKALEKKISARIEARATGQYTGSDELFTVSQAYDEEALTAYKTRLKAVK